MTTIDGLEVNASESGTTLTTTAETDLQKEPANNKSEMPATDQGETLVGAQLARVLLALSKVQTTRLSFMGAHYYDSIHRRFHSFILLLKVAFGVIITGHNSLQPKYDELCADLNAAKTEAAALRETLRQRDTDIESLRTENTNLNEHFLGSLAALSDELTTCQTQCDTAIQQNIDLTTREKSLTRDRKALEAAKIRQAEQMHKIQDAETDLRQQCSGLSTELNNYRERVETLEQNIQDRAFYCDEYRRYYDLYQAA